MLSVRFAPHTDTSHIMVDTHTLLAFYCIIYFFLGLTITVKSDGLHSAPKPFSPIFPFPFNQLSAIRALSSHQQLLELQVDFAVVAVDDVVIAVIVGVADVVLLFKPSLCKSGTVVTSLELQEDVVTVVVNVDVVIAVIVVVVVFAISTSCQSFITSTTSRASGRCCCCCCCCCYCCVDISTSCLLFGHCRYINNS